MDRVQIRTKTPVAEFLSRFRFGPREPAEKIVSQEGFEDRQEGRSTSVDVSFPEHSIINPEYPKLQRGTCAVGPVDQEDPKEGTGDKRNLCVVEIPDEEKGDEVLTYKRRAQTGRQKSRENPEDTVLDSRQDGSDLGADWHASSDDQTSYTSGKMCAKASKDADNFSPAEGPSIVKTWKSRIGPQKTVAPKRILGQYFLDYGQSDFSYSTCPICGLFYTPGHQNDEKIHTTFHRNFIKGIQFKGWQSERVASRLDHAGNRVIVVLAEDTHHQRKVVHPPRESGPQLNCGLLDEVREVIDIMEVELGLTPGWLLQKSCKVYLFISSSKKIAGCLVAEPITSAFRLVSDECQRSGNDAQDGDSKEVGKHKSNVLLFGNIKFSREMALRKRKRVTKEQTEDLGRAILCTKTPVPAVCGVRVIWVSESERRKGIASHLLDAMRKTFCLGIVLEPSQFAFSQPTPEGRKFAGRYCKTNEFLVYTSS